MGKNTLIWGSVIYGIALIVLIIILYHRLLKLKENKTFDPTPEEILDILKKISTEKKIYSRSLDDERVFMEDLLVKRIHYLILIFSIFFGAAMNISNDLHKSIILFIGTIFCFIMGDIVKRAHYKHHWIMRILYGKDVKYTDNLKVWEDHPVKLIDDAMNSNTIRHNKSKGSVSYLNGYFLPNLTVYVSLISALFFLFSFIQENNQKAKFSFIDTKGKMIEIKGDLYKKDYKNYIILRDSVFITKIVIE
jgi:hypothetical protein